MSVVILCGCDIHAFANNSDGRQLQWLHSTAGAMHDTNLTNLRVYSTIVGMSVSPLQYVHRGKALCCPRDLVSQPLVVGSVVKEGNGHLRLEGRELHGSGRKRGEALCT